MRGQSKTSKAAVADDEKKRRADSQDRVAVTLRLDQTTFVRLKIMAARCRRSSQDILLDALKARLDAYEKDGAS